MKRVNKYTRAGKNGKNIQCPYCNHIIKVYHFSWSASICGTSNHSPLGCGMMVEKNDWLVIE